ncbi:hypothetical protein DVH05_014641 [Phytophthora capsici]|nr:hypothetical protein DVH05_014641 [Phytophthora capsici]
MKKWHTATKFIKLIERGLSWAESIDFDVTMPQSFQVTEQSILPAKLKAIPLLSSKAEILDLIGKTQLSDDTMGFVMSSLFESKASIITVDTNVIGPMEHGAVSVPMTVFADMFKNLSKEKILIPVCCNKNHWCGIMVDVDRTEAIVYDPMASTYMNGVRALTEKIVTQLPTFAPRKYRVSPYRGNLGVQVDSFNCGMYVLLAFEVFAGADELSYLNRKELQYLRYRYLCMCA